LESGLPAAHSGVPLPLRRLESGLPAAHSGVPLPLRRLESGLSSVPADRERCEEIFLEVIREEKQNFLGWRDVPVDVKKCGELSREVMPSIRQIFIGRGQATAPGDAFERKLYVIRKCVEARVRQAGLKYGEDFYVCSLSHRTIVYKGQLTASQIPQYFLDLQDENLNSAIAMVHQRFSTNTFPSWKRAHPYHYVIHNGDINTVRGNVNWMRAREACFQSDLFGDEIKKILPIVDPDGSDSAMFDNALELLVHTGRPLSHAVMMMIPEAWQKDKFMGPAKRAFYQYHSCMMEPWDGPASIAFSDVTVIGAVLDRNGLRPSRYYVTKDDLVVMASEVGVLDIPPENILLKERLHPGRIFLVDTAQGRIIDDEEIKRQLAAERPYAEWLKNSLVRLEDLTPAPDLPPPDHETVLQRQRSVGYTQEDLRLLLEPMALGGEEAIGSMGTDTALAVLSDRPRLLYDYFKQLFAQVTNPPLDAIREELVTSMESTIGPERNLLNPSLRETIREFSTLDGAFVIAGNGEVITAGRYLGAATEESEIPRGLGSRHIAAAGITALTNAIAIVISESTGDVRIFKGGKVIMSLDKANHK
jgi:glutamate synthase (ferredoxin)